MGRRIRYGVGPVDGGVSVTSSGFRLTSLTLIGSGARDAEVRFRGGLNVILGPSDTGETFVAQCIDFMLGAGRTPKEIPEAAAYDSVVLGLSAPDDQSEFVRKRSLRGGDVRLFVNGKPDRILGAKHQAENENTVSHFLLELSGLTGRKVRTNKQGKTRTLSFRDLTRLILVDEETVIREASPIFSGQYTLRTAENSVFRLLLTGVDDSSVVAKDDPVVSKSRQEGKAEMIEVLLERARKQIADMKLDGDAVALREQLDRVESLFDKASEELAAEQETVAALEERRRKAWRGLRQVESRVDVLSELQRRFELLQDQYSSDLRRLDAISEAGGRLGQMKEERCPICGALAEHHDREHQDPQAAPDEVANACIAEAQKIRVLLADLRSTLANNATEVKRLKGQESATRAELEAAGGEIRNRVQPRVQAALQKLRDNQAQRDSYRRAVEIYDRVEEMERLLSEARKPKRPESADGPSTAVGANEAEQFSKEVEALLRAWHFPNLDRVTFSEDDRDIVISGRRRASHGKGVRAITHAAFNLALLRYCYRRSMPHPGVVVIDSPLVVYREPDTDEQGFTPDLKDAFYRWLAVEFNSSQIIILENEDPPSDIQNDAQVTKFTGTSSGRAGFIPRPG